jgi:hypothetical protein
MSENRDDSGGMGGDEQHAGVKGVVVATQHSVRGC